MATMPGGGGGGLSITGDPEMEELLGSIQGQMIGQSQGKQLMPEASKWSKYWDLQEISQAFWPPQPTGPKATGFGVLKEGTLPDNSEFWITDDARAKRFESVTEGRNKDRQRLQKLADEYYGRPATPSEVAAFWELAIEDLDAAEKMGADVKDPWHWLDLRAKNEQLGKTAPGPRTETSVQRTINLTDPTTATAVIDTTLRNLLGRRATEDERAQFMSTLREQEEDNPTVTTTTREYDGVQGEAVETTSTTTGGAPDPATSAQSWADEERLGEQKAMLAASYYNVLAGL